MGLGQLRRAVQLVLLSILVCITAIALLVIFFAPDLLESPIPQAFAPDLVASSNAR